MKVPLHFINAEISPGVKISGGVVSHVMNDLDIACLPDDLPEFIEVDLSSLTLSHSVHVSDIKLPKGVIVASHGNIGAGVVATVQIPRGAIEAAATAVATDAAVAPAADAKAAAKPAAGAAAQPAASAKPAAAKPAAKK